MELDEGTDEFYGAWRCYFRRFDQQVALVQLDAPADRFPAASLQGRETENQGGVRIGSVLWLGVCSRPSSVP